MAVEHLFPSAPLLLSEQLSLLRLLLEVDPTLDGVRLPTLGGRLDRFGRKLFRRRKIARRREIAQALLEGRQAAVAPGGRGLDDDVADPEDGAASLALEAHVSFGQ
jgi:hypothetical protein